MSWAWGLHSLETGRAGADTTSMTAHDLTADRPIDLRAACPVVESLIPVVQRALTRSAVLRDARLVLGTTPTGELTTRIVAGVR